MAELVRLARGLSVASKITLNHGDTVVTLQQARRVVHAIASAMDAAVE